MNAENVISSLSIASKSILMTLKKFDLSTDLASRGRYSINILYEVDNSDIPR
jgi:hypothetical protein